MKDQDFFRASQARTQRGLTTFDIALDSAIVDRVINSPGTLFYLDKTSTGICTVEGSVDQGTTGNALLASPGFSLFNEGGFSGFRISAPAQAGKVLRIVIGTGVSVKPGDAVQSGSVATATVDGAKARTLNAQAFRAAIVVGIVAGQYPHVQLMNPTGSGKNIFISSVSFYSTLAGPIASGFYSTPLTTLWGGGLTKLNGGTSGVAQRRVKNDVTLLVASNNVTDLTALAANTTYQFKLAEPLCITPGNGFVVLSQTIASDLVASFEWFEE
jgi:hypothetical protein